MHEIMQGVQRGVPGMRPGDARMPFAQWMDPEVIRRDVKTLGFDLENREGKIFLGMLNGQLIGVDDNRHVTLCCGSRAGKTVSIIAPLLLSGPRNRSMAVIDVKDELANLSAYYRAKKLGQWVGIWKPFGRLRPELEPYRVSNNLMSILTPWSETLAEDAGLLASAIVMRSGDDNFWDDCAEALIEGLILHVATAPAFAECRNLVTVRQLLRNGMNNSLRKEMEDNEAADGIIQGAACDFWERADQERGGVLSTARRHTKFLDYPAMQKALSDPEDESRRFQFTDLKTKPEGMTLYCCLPVGRISTTCNRMFRLAVSMTLEAMEREQRRDNETFVILDEYANAVGPMRAVEVAAGLVAGMGCRLLFVLQGLSQIKTMIKDYETLLANSGLQIFYGVSDLTTTEYIQKRCGQTTVMVESEGQGEIARRTDTGAGRSRAPHVTDLITADEAARLFARDDPLNRMLVLWSGHAPMILQRTKYYEYAPFSRLYDRWDR